MGSRLVSQNLDGLNELVTQTVTNFKAMSGCKNNWSILKLRYFLKIRAQLHCTLSVEPDLRLVVIRLFS